jgi:hypothetical protein
MLCVIKLEPTIMEIYKGHTNKIAHKYLVPKLIIEPFFGFGIGFRWLHFVAPNMRPQNVVWQIKIP